MAGKGGYQAPANPAPSSGPGRLSRRTDGGPAQPIRQIPGGSYGDRKELTQLQQAAPLSQTPSLPAASSGGGGAAAPQDQGVQPIPLSAPTARPDEPVTAGAAAGPGPGPEALGLPQQPVTAYATAAQALQAAAAQTNNPDLQWLAQRANQGRF